MSSTNPYYHHRVVYPDGTIIKGQVDHIPFIVGELGLRRFDGLSVLDVGCNDGQLSFFPEAVGASRVVACDVGNYRDYDWGPQGPPAGIDSLDQQDKWEVFDIHHKALGSKVEKRTQSVYDLAGEKFDVVFCFGVLYHLRNPILAAQRCFEVCKGFSVFETPIISGADDVAISVECGAQTSIGSISDLVIPSESCAASWLLKAGFDRLYVSSSKAKARRRIVGIVDSKYEEHFSKLQTLELVDDKYWGRVKAATKSWFTKP